MRERPIQFYSEGIKLLGSLWLPDDYQEGQKLPCVIPCSGTTGLKAVYPELYARFFTQYGYAVIGFDYRGWAPSEGPVGYTSLEGEYQDILAAYTFATVQPEIDPANIGLFGWGFAAAIVIMLAADYPEIKAVACGNGVYNGKKMLQGQPAYPVYLQLAEAARQDRIKRVLTGEGDFVMPYETISKPEQYVGDGGARRDYQDKTLKRVNPDIQEVLMRDYGGAENFPPKQSWILRDSYMRMNAGRYIREIAPRGVFLCGSIHDTAYPYEQTTDMANLAGPGCVLYPVDGSHNDWMFDDDPRFLNFIDAMVRFFDSYLK